MCSRPSVLLLPLLLSPQATPLWNGVRVAGGRERMRDPWPVHALLDPPQIMSGLCSSLQVFSLVLSGSLSSFNLLILTWRELNLASFILGGKVVGQFQEVGLGFNPSFQVFGTLVQPQLPHLLIGYNLNRLSQQNKTSRAQHGSWHRVRTSSP